MLMAKCCQQSQPHELQLTMYSAPCADSYFISAHLTLTEMYFIFQYLPLAFLKCVFLFCQANPCVGWDGGWTI